jgi:hypothetical protein
MIGIRPGCSCDLAFHGVAATPGVGAGGSLFVSIGLAIASEARVVVVHVPTVGPTVVGVVIAAWAWARRVVSTSRRVCIALHVASCA